MNGFARNRFMPACNAQSLLYESELADIPTIGRAFSSGTRVDLDRDCYREREREYE